MKKRRLEGERGRDGRGGGEGGEAKPALTATAQKCFYILKGFEKEYLCLLDYYCNESEIDGKMPTKELPLSLIHVLPTQLIFVATGGRQNCFLAALCFQKTSQYFIYFLSNLCTFCVVSLTDSVN